MANINKNIIMQAGAAVANATNKAAGLSAATPEPGSIISAIQLVNGGRTIGPDALAHFTESVRNKLLSLLVNMEPIQDFNGYGHPWPAGGGKNKLLIQDKDSGGITGGYNSAGEYVITGTAGNVAVYCDFTSVTLPAGSYVFSISTLPTGLNAGYTKNGAWAGIVTDGNVITLTEEASIGGYISIAANTEVNTSVKIQLEAGSTKTAWTPYSNICPISGRTGLSVYVGPTSAIGDATTYSMDWISPAGTVYAGSADIVSGDIKAAPYYASYNGETLVGPWFSSMDVYDPDGTPTTGAQVVDLGGALTEYHITGQDIITLVGDNYIWSDSGDVTITE